MNQPFEPIGDLSEPQVLQDLIAGRLSAQRENELIVQCECEPDRWRDVALGFLEHRALRRVLTNEFDIEADVKADLTSDGGVVELNRSESRAPVSRTPRSRIPVRESNWRKILALAASVLLLCSMSVLFYQLGRGHVDDSNVALTDSDGASSSHAKPDVGGDVDNDVASTNEAGSDDDSEEAYEQYMRSIVSDEAREVLRESGFQVDEEVEFKFSTDEDGKPIAVPNRKVRIEYLADNS